MKCLFAVTTILSTGWAFGALAAPSAQEVVMSTSDQVIARLKTQDKEANSDPVRVHALVDEVVVPHFDFVRMSKLVLGKNWRGAELEQKKRFVEEFRKFLIRTYAKALEEYTDEEILYHPVRAEDDAERVTVKTEVIRSGGPSIPIDYRMYRKDMNWKVFDVLVDGISLVSTHRGSFAAEIRKSGLDGLIEELVARNGKRGG